MKTILTVLLLIVSSFFPSLMNAQENLSVNENIKKLLSNYYKNKTPYKLYISTDKVIYESEEQIWITALLLDRTTHKLANENSIVELTLSSKEGMSITSRQFQLSSGTGKITIAIPEIINDGEFLLSASLKDYPEVFYERTIELRHRSIPSFIVNATIKNKFLTGGETFDTHIQVSDYFSVPLKNVQFNANLFSGKEVMSIAEGKFDKSGKAIISFTLPEVLKKEAVYISLNLKHNYLDEEYTIPIPVKNDMVFLDFFPAGGQLVHGLSNIIKLKSFDVYGNSFPFKADIVNKDGKTISSISSDPLGHASLPILPDYNNTLKLVIKDPYLVEKEFDLPEIKPVGIYFLALEDNDSVRLIVKSTPTMMSKEVHLINIHRGTPYTLSKLTLSRKNDFKIPKASFKDGINQITIFNENSIPLAENLYYKSPENLGKISATPINDAYHNREKIIFDYNIPEQSILMACAADQYRQGELNNKGLLVDYAYLDSEIIDLYINHQSKKTDNKPAINKVIDYHLPINTWDDIFAFSNIEIGFNYKYNRINLIHLSNSLTMFKDKDFINFTNYTYDNYYLAANPILFKKLTKEEKREQKPAYKSLLENGTKVRDVIYTMKPFEVINNGIVFFGSQNSLIAQQGALIIVNGVRTGENIGVLDQISPFDVDEIIISTNPSEIHNYTALNSVGVIDIRFKDGTENNSVESEPALTEFEHVDYEKDGKKLKNKDDLRTTLYWEPFHQVQSSENELKYFHSDIRGKFIGTIQGIDKNGNVIDFHFDYESIQYMEKNQ